MRTEPRTSYPDRPTDSVMEPTLVELLSELAAAGYDKDVFVREDDGFVCCSSCRACQPPDQLQLDGLRRVEGASDPADMAAVLAVQCAACGTKGTAIVRFGPEATAGEATLLQAIDDARPRGLDVAERAGADQGAGASAEPALRQAGNAWQDLAHRLEATEALDAPREVLEKLVEAVPDPARRMLRGDWLGHPVHPALTDLPIGFWTSSMVLDLVPTKGAARASTALVGLGIASVVPTAAAGLVDWAERPKELRRVGVVHLAANSAATAAYTASFIARLRGRRLKGVALGLVGATLATAGGALGGHLAFGSSSEDRTPG